MIKDSYAFYNILPISRGWYFTGTAQYDWAPVEECYFCRNNNSKYLFKVAQMNDGDTKWIDERCLKRLAIMVYEPNTRFKQLSQQQIINRIKRCLQTKVIINLLEQLSSSYKKHIFKQALNHYRESECLTPKQAYEVLHKLYSDEINFSPSFMKVCLNTVRMKYELAQMPTKHVSTLWKSLTPNQRKLAASLGHKI